MMLPPVFQILSQNSRVSEIVASRIYRRGAAPQTVQAPYLSWYVVTGTPENTLSETPSKDRMTVQVDCWTKTDKGTEILAIAVRDAIEQHAHLTSMPIEGRESETKLWRQALEFDFFVDRPLVEPTS